MIGSSENASAVAQPEGSGLGGRLLAVAILIAVILLTACIPLVIDHIDNITELSGQDRRTVPGFLSTGPLILAGVLLYLSAECLKSGFQSFVLACRIYIATLIIEVLGYFSGFINGLIGYAVFNPIWLYVPAGYFIYAFLRLVLQAILSRNVSHRKYIPICLLASVCCVLSLYLIVLFTKSYQLGLGTGFD